MVGNYTVSGASKDKKFSAIVGARYQDRNLVLNTMDSNSDLAPVYYDLQANLHYKFNPKWEISLLGAITDSKYELTPKDIETKFGTLDNPMSLKVFYEENEEGRFQTETTSLTVHQKPNSNLY